jgi:hypothetical protein
VARRRGGGEGIRVRDGKPEGAVGSWEHEKWQVVNDGLSVRRFCYIGEFDSVDVGRDGR